MMNAKQALRMTTKETLSRWTETKTPVQTESQVRKPSTARTGNPEFMAVGDTLVRIVVGSK